MFSKMVLALGLQGLSLLAFASGQDTDAFMNALSIPPGVPATNVYAWIPPANVPVEDQVLSFCPLAGGEEHVFDLVATGNVLVAHCCVGCAESSRQATRRLCEHLVFGVDMPMSTYASRFMPVRNELGDVQISKRIGQEGIDVTRCHRTAGNLYLSVRTYTNAVPLNAEAVADALLSTRTAARE